jgi:hypothetical protein
MHPQTDCQLKTTPLSWPHRTGDRGTPATSFGLDGQSRTDASYTVAAGDGVGLENGSSWTVTGGLDDEGSVDVVTDSQVTDQGSDLFGIRWQLSVDGAGSEYSDTGDVTDNGLILISDGADITVGGTLTGTGDINLGTTGTTGASATLGRVTLAGLGVNTASSLTAGKDTPVAVAQTSGRQRLNIHGAIDLETGQTRMLEALTADAASTIMLLMAIEAM